FARYISLPFEAQNLPLQIHQTAIFQTEFEQAPRAMQQIQMLHARERMPRAVHGVPGFKQRLVEGPAVESDQNVEAFEILTEAFQSGSFFIEIPQEILAHSKALVFNAAEADEKCAGPAAARKTGGFGIEEGPTAGAGIRDFPAGDAAQQRWVEL